MSRSKVESPDKAETTPEVGWRAVHWEDLETWAGKKTVERGKRYQKDGRVGDLVVAKDGDLLATVAGTEEYSTRVRLEDPDGSRVLDSICSCPVGFACKHAVATIVEYLHALAAGRDVPAAVADDPRMLDLDGPDDEGYEDEPRPRRSPLATKTWDERIRASLRAMSRDELVDKLWSIATTVPDVYDALREAVALQELDPAGLVAEGRRAIKDAASVAPWRNHWDDEGELPDYRPVERVLERLLELDRADDVVALGRDLLKKGFAQAARSDDEGETAARLRRCLEIVFKAVAKSSMPCPDRLLFAIDAYLDDPSEVVTDDTVDPVLDAHPAAADWAVVADKLTARLKAGSGRGSRDALDRFDRAALVDWIAEALEKAGREDELLPLYESEARITGDRASYIAMLIDEGRLDDAERESRESLTEKVGSDPAAAVGLMKTLADLAARRERWDVVAAHAAREFFDRPEVDTFEALMKAARKARVEPAVRAAALRYLEDGRPPHAWFAAKLAPKPKAGKKPVAKPAEPAHLKVDPSWPLPVPDELIAPLKSRAGAGFVRARPGVLIDLALYEGDVAAALDHYDALEKRDGTSFFAPQYNLDRYADRVAEAAAASHPERALKIYKAALDRALPIADARAYERAARILAALKPIHDALGRGAEWSALVASTRETYRNRPRFLKQLDQALGRSS